MHIRPEILVALTCLLCLAASRNLPAGELENGIYALSSDGGTKVTRTIGDTIHLGKKLSSDLGKASLRSTSNGNERLRLELEGVKPFDMSGQFAVYVDGVCEVVDSRNAPAGSKLVNLSASLHGSVNADRVAKHFGIQPELRQHPGHQFAVAFKTTKLGYTRGGPVVIELQIKNVGKTSVRFIDGGQQRGPRNNQFGFISSPPIADTGDPMNFGGMGSNRKLKPNEVFKKQVDVTKWFKFPKSGSYNITGLFELELLGEEDTIVWDDTVVGRCTVNIL